MFVQICALRSSHGGLYFDDAYVEKAALLKAKRSYVPPVVRNWQSAWMPFYSLYLFALLTITAYDKASLN